MSQAGSGREQTGDLEWLRPPQRTCFFCRRVDPGGTDILGGYGGTPIPACAAGTGCRDGRIYHGPQGPPHWPGENCEVCARTGDPAPARRMRGNLGRPRHFGGNYGSPNSRHR